MSTFDRLKVGVGANRYRFNGIEHEESVGLDLAFFRSYDPAIGRWMQIDPQASKYYSLSPYNGMGNNPIIYNDPMGDALRIQSSEGNTSDGGGNAVVDQNGEVIAGNGHSSITYTPGMALTGQGGFTDNVIGMLNYIYENLGQEGIDALVGKGNTTIVPYKRTKMIGANAHAFDDNRKGVGGSYLMTNPGIGMEFHSETDKPSTFQSWFGKWGYRSPTEALNHEIEHGRSYYMDPGHSSDSGTYDSQYGNLEEKQAFEVENAAARKLFGNGAVIRTHHGGYFVLSKHGIYPKL